jgi:3-oxoacyl-[acyl-carrier-protein] synthase III
MPFHNGESQRAVRVTGTGRCLPGPQISNAELLARCSLPPEVTQEWISNRIGINTRFSARHAPFEKDGRPAQGKHCSDLAANAAFQALEMAGITSLKDLDLLVVATCTPDVPVPATSTLVQEKLARMFRAKEQEQATPENRAASPAVSASPGDVLEGSKGTTGETAGASSIPVDEDVEDIAWDPFAALVEEDFGEDGATDVAVMDVRSACCGSTQAFITALNMLETGYFNRACVVGVDLGSVFGDVLPLPGMPKMECVNVAMMGDAAGAVVLEAFGSPGGGKSEDSASGEDGAEKAGMEISFTMWKSIGVGKKPGMWLPGGGSSCPCSQSAVDAGMHRFHHSFREVLQVMFILPHPFSFFFFFSFSQNVGAFLREPS